MTNLAKNLTDTTRAHAGRAAVRVDNAAMTYRALDEASARVAALLRERGTRVWDTDPARLAANICQTLKAPVLPTLWREYLPDLPYTPVCG